MQRALIPLLFLSLACAGCVTVPSAARLDAAEVPHSPAHGYTGVYTLQVLFSAIQSSTCSLHAVECGRSLCASLPSEVA